MEIKLWLLYTPHINTYLYIRDLPHLPFCFLIIPGTDVLRDLFESRWRVSSMKSPAWRMRGFHLHLLREVEETLGPCERFVQDCFWQGMIYNVDETNSLASLDKLLRYSHPIRFVTRVVP